MDSANGYANPMALVSTDWVADHLHDPNVRLLEVDVDTTAFERGHIEGTVVGAVDGPVGHCASVPGFWPQHFDFTH